MVEGDAVLAIGEGGVDIGVQRTGGRKGVALNAGDLDEAADGVASHAQMVFKAHFGRILDLGRAASKEHAGGGRRHGAGHAHLALAADLGAGDGGVLLDDIAHDTGRSQRVADLLVAEGVSLGQVVKDARHDAAGAAGRGRDDGAAGSVFLGNGQSIGEYESTGTEVGLVAHGLDMIGRCLACQVQRTGQAAVRIQAALDGGLHRLPDFLEVVPDFRTLVHIDILPETPAGGVAPLSDFREGVHVVHIPGNRHLPARALGQSAATHAEHGPFIHNVGFPVDGLEQHAVRVVFEHGFGLPDHPDGRDRL